MIYPPKRDDVGREGWDWRSFVREQLARLDVPAERQIEIVDEVAGQLESTYARAKAEGASDDDAIARAMAEVPDWQSFAAAVNRIERKPAPPPVPGAVRGDAAGVLDGFWQDLRHASRSLTHAPAFTAAAIVTLMLGLAATTSVGSAAAGVLLRPLPFRAPGELVLVMGNAIQGFDHTPLSVADAQDLAKDAGVFQSFGAWSSLPEMRVAVGAERPEEIHFAIATSGLFQTLGIEPELGRWFSPQEDEPGAAPVAVISHSLWQRRFGELKPHSTLAGRTILIDGQSYDVVGVLPAGFRFATVPDEADVWIPLGRDPNQGRRFSRGTRFMLGIGRLKPELTLTRAAEGVGLVNRRLQKEFPDMYRNRHFDVMTLESETTRELRAPLVLLFAAAVMMLLIACVNVANLIVVRAAARAKEFAVRVSLGASRARLASQAFAETALIALIAAAGGLVLAATATGVIARLLERTPNPFIPYTFERTALAVDPLVAAAAAAFAILFCLLFAQTSVWRTSVLNPADVLRASGIGAGLTSRRWRQALVGAEVALSVVLLTGAALLARTLNRIDTINPGFDPEHVVTAEVNLRASAYRTGASVITFYDRVLASLAAEPGVTSASLSDMTPLGGRDSTTGIIVDGRPDTDPSLRPRVHTRTVAPGYFKTLGIAVTQGRAIDDTDIATSQRVTVINETLARQLWPSESAIGKRFTLDFEAMRFFRDRPPVLDLEAGWRVVVGVVADVKHTGLTTDPVAEAFAPMTQRPARATTLVIRGIVDANVVEQAVRRIVTAADAQQPVGRIRALPDIVAASTARPRSSAALLVTLSALALVLAGIGIYGVVAYSMTLRVPEIGMRMALGADRVAIARLVGGEGLAPCMVGLLAGAAGAAALSRVIESLLYGVSPLDPLAFTAGAAAMLLAAALACVMPIVRALRLEPLAALRAN